MGSGHHFENTAAVNEWNDAKKLLWLKARLTGRAQLALQHLPEEMRESHDSVKRAMQDRFEPPSRKGRYQAEFHTRRKVQAEGWANFAQDLQNLADKAFPHLQAEARYQLALTHYLAQIENPQLAFSVKQQKPANLHAAVSATLEMESYLLSKLTTARTDLEGPTKTDTVTAASTKEDQESTSHLMKQLLERMGRMEVELHQSKQIQSSHRKTDSNSQAQRKPPVVCWNCNRPGHIARNSRLQPPQGNANPYAD